ncbi:sushi, von Willebrand factor type A, EGF and pentraxin domain-containing 1 isoform X1 [Olea europaea subsp. europaea]|uniref:Sushi, von Willebrand factor type A, EGF and pentraxin domain-containing 1 isoform X1 n=1 Tax=Olea europaea subsp. europaea TaxID=158383 RepID=A0A8S0TNU7_OLEEU|nr:sushi, von Willebrand factor type A, EGF and pentraxin domain-containing 1 isoform X1 [Olea europaea subsp. europaea]
MAAGRESAFQCCPQRVVFFPRKFASSQPPRRLCRLCRAPIDGKSLLLRPAGRQPVDPPRSLAFCHSLTPGTDRPTDRPTERRTRVERPKAPAHRQFKATTRRRVRENCPRRPSGLAISSRGGRARPARAAHRARPNHAPPHENNRPAIVLPSGDHNSLAGSFLEKSDPPKAGIGQMQISSEAFNLCPRRVGLVDEARRCRHNHLFAHNSAQLITSPFYPDQYPGAIECVYRLVAPAGKLIQLELIELDLAPGRDFLIVRDGAQSADALLVSLTGQLKQNEPSRHLISTSNKLYVYFKTEHSAQHEERRRGFAIRFRTGCDLNVVAANGTLTSPAYQVGRYASNQQCVLRLSRPDLQSAGGAASQLAATTTPTTTQDQQQQVAQATTTTSGRGLTLRFDDFDLGPDDQLLAYDGHEPVAGQRIQPVRQSSVLGAKSSNSFAESALLSAPSGRMTLVFSSSALPGVGGSGRGALAAAGPNRGFKATFSADCPPLKLGRGVIVAQGQQVALAGARFGQQLTYTCPRGQEFSNGQLKLHNECLMGGRWTMSRVPNCQERYCGPVPQIDNGFAINATGVTFNQTATYRCYNGFALASGRQTETVTCLESGTWGKLPECYSTSCPPLREVPNSRQLVLAGSGQTRSYGTVLRFECEPGYQRVGVPSLLCTSSGTWSSQPPECVRAQCKEVPQVENGQLVELDSQASSKQAGGTPVAAGRKFFFQDEARVQCHRGYKLELPPSSPTTTNANSSTQSTNQQQVERALSLGVIRCGAGRSFEQVPRCVDIDECQLATTCDLATTSCRNLPGGYSCDCKAGFSSNFECKTTSDLGLTSGHLPDSSIRVSSSAPGFDKNNIRLFKSGWCGASQLPGDNQVRVDLQTVTIIRGLRIQPVNLSPATGLGSAATTSQQQQQQPVQAFPSLLRLRYANNLTDTFKDYQDATKRAVQFRLNNLNSAGIFHVNLPVPIEARYLELVIVEFQNSPCMRIELTGCVRQSCLDVNECLENNGGCSHRCLNSPGSFACACERGHDLFTSNGTHGFFIPPEETGTRDGDLLRLNKTCVPKRCPSVSEPANGQLLTTRRLFHFGDSVRFKCNFGFVMSASSPILSCSANGQWNGTEPECHQARCKPLSNDRAQGLVARFEPLSSPASGRVASSDQDATAQQQQQQIMSTNDGQLPFLSNMTVYCKEPGRMLRPTASANFRQCVYNIRNDTGRGDYWFSGTSPACPRVDCGVPAPTSGALPYQYSDTKFGSSFFFGCEDTYNLAGSAESRSSGNVVTCKADGTWDFGDLRCEGPVCQDPGRAPDGEQLATSYEPGSQVRFKCKRPGFVPYSSDPLECTRNADCRVIRPLGLASGLLPDRAINASSYRDNYEPSKVRLGSSTGWCARMSEMPYLTVDLGRPHKIKALLLKGVVTVDVVGRPLEVRVFYKKPGQQEVSVIYPNFNLSTAVDLLQQQLGLANYGELSVIQLPNAIVAQTIGVNIVRSIRNPCMRMEILGCDDLGRDVILGYDQPAPVCVDQEPPQFVACPEQPVQVQRGAYGELLPVNFTIPQAFDNSGLVARLEVRPRGFRPGQFVFHDQQVHYIASDNDGNVAICSVNITVPDVTPPRLACPPSLTQFLDLPPLSNSQTPMSSEAITSSQLFDFNALAREKVRASDDSGPVYLDVVPSSASISVDSFENVTVFARDRHNNTAQCSFQVRLRAPTCSRFSLEPPANGQLECLPKTELATGSISSTLFQCVATCNEGYRFLDGRRAHTYECDNNAQVAPRIQDCVPSQEEESSYNVLATVNYKLVWGSPTSQAQIANSPETLVECMTNYTEYVRQYAPELQKILTNRCSVLNGEMNVEFLNIRSYLRQISREKQEELVAIQYEMRIDSKVKKGPIFKLCGQTVRQTFNLGLPASAIIGPLKNLSLASLAGGSPMSANEEAPPSPPPSSAAAAAGDSALALGAGSICPTLIAVSSSAQAGYKCAPGLILTNQSVQATGSTSSRSGDSSGASSDSIELGAGSDSQDSNGEPPEMEVPICLQCPAGTYSQPEAAGQQLPKANSPVGAPQCKLCPRGFYQDQTAQAECKQCPELTFTLSEGAKSPSECQPVCAFGHYSETGLAPCQECPVDTFSAGPNNPQVAAGYTECQRCPPTRPHTYAPGSASPSECRAKCQPGSYSDTGLEPCSPCPTNFYQSNEGATKCDECGMSNRTLKVGASSADQCVPSSCMPTLNPTSQGPCLPESDEAQRGRCFAGCQQNGVCTIQLHEPQCHCPSGFTGKFCEIEINECSAEPCYNGGTCLDLKQGYKCKCPPGFTGLQCQIEQSQDCSPKSATQGVGGESSCPERSMCQDLPGPNNFTCLCRTGYTGPQCNITVNPCEVMNSPAVGDTPQQQQAPCLNQAQCVPLKQGRHKCLCPPGWTGARCEINVDDCAEEPCLMGAKCTDLVNDYHCECPPGFTGKRCHEKVDQCAGEPCGPNGVCVDRLFSFECICHPGWRGERCNSTLDACASSPCLNNGECVSSLSWPISSGSLANQQGAVAGQTHRAILERLAAAGENQQQQQELKKNQLPSQPATPASASLLAELARLEQATNFKCLCDPRFTGARCQHDVDSCETNKCEHGGTCLDTPDGFECKCKPGFVGLNCEVQVRECASEPCSAPGTLECQDLPNAHKCVCRPGYTGDRCDVEVNECDQEPCQNGATCQDKVNDYQCVCPPGWQGKDCDQDVSRCSAQEPCLNNAKCVDLFEDYFCVCPSGTDGKRCQTSPRRCIGEPCQNSGQCHDFGSGLNCTCSHPKYSGAGCQYLHEPCGSELAAAATCKNGATCLDLGNQEYRCECPPGWMGRHCDQDAPDCGPHSCPPNAQCIDLTNKFYCKCPFDMTGEDCRKPINVDYDLNFNSVAKSSSASQAVPFEFGLLQQQPASPAPVRALSIGVWVQFSGNQVHLLEGGNSPATAASQPRSASGAARSAANAKRHHQQVPGGQPQQQQQVPGEQVDLSTGVFLTLYSSESPHRAVRKRELAKFDHAGVSVSFLPNQTAEFLPYLSNVPINDGQWHYLALVWDGPSGNLSLITDAAVAATRTSYARDESLETYAKFGYLNLGAELSQDDSNRALEGSGFFGRLSRVNVWSKALDINSEIPKQFRSCKAGGGGANGQQQQQVARERLLSQWAHFDLIQGHVERDQPGQCGQRVCPVGLTGDECAILQQDKRAPQVLLCPPDMWVITANASTSIEWDEPHFIDDLAKPVAVAEQNNLKPGAMFAHGVYDLSYLAVDESGNTARCDFQIRVLKDFCPIPLAPVNGRANCKAWGPNGRFRTCSIECNEGFEFSQPVSQHYVCGAEGFWRPTSDPQRELVFPACTPRHSAQRIYKMSVNFPSSAICSESGKRILNSRIAENLLRIDQSWKLCSSGPSGGSSSSGVSSRTGGSASDDGRGKCENLRVNVKCTKQTPLGPLTGVGQTGGGSGPLSSSTSAFYASPTQVGKRARRWSGSGEPGQDSAGAKPQEDVYVVEVSFPANADPISNANSPKSGKRNITDILREAIFKESILDVHQTLPNVQPDITSLELSNEYACEPGTVVVGSSCVECAPGTFYEDSSRACNECPTGSYQDETRSTQCKSCPQINGKLGVTAQVGARSADQCKERCAPGKFYDDQAALCRSCGYGFFQPLEGSFACQPCGQGLTTRSLEASSRHECRPECDPGQQLSPQGACEPCPLGSFRSRGRPACEQCPSGYTTETVGSSERRQCNLLLCPAGHYLNVTSDRCQECPRGFYQAQEQRDTSCLSCPQDTTTELEGATSLENCTNPCFINGQSQMCQANSYCVFSKEAQNYTCECKPKYRMDELEQCVYVCDDFCLNGGSCSANNEQNRPRCDCPPSFYGERCERKSEFIYIASAIGVGLAVILFIVLLLWMICVRTSTSSSSSSMSHLAVSSSSHHHHHPTKQALQSLAASQLDFATLAAAAAAVNGGGAQGPPPPPLGPNGAGTLPHPPPVGGGFYYGNNGYAESLAPSHQSAYAHYYDDEDDDAAEAAWAAAAAAAAAANGDVPNFYQEAFLAQNQKEQIQNQNNQNLTSQQQQQQQKGNYETPGSEHLMDLTGPLNNHHQPQAVMQSQAGQTQGGHIANKDELYDRLKRHLYTGQKGDTTDSGGEEAH